MHGRFGCWSLISVVGLAALFPPLYYLASSGGRAPMPAEASSPAPSAPFAPSAPSVPSAPSSAPSSPPAGGAVCLEAWVRLRSHRGCPVLAAAGGYRLGIYCWPAAGARPSGSAGKSGSSHRAAGSNGALVFAGPFSGRAYISERPVPLGEWVHLAGIAVPPTPPTPPTPPIVAIAGRQVTAGRLFGESDPLPLGYDPWDSILRRWPPDGEVGAWRLSFARRSLEEVAAGRGTPRRLAPLPPPAAPPAARSAGARRPAGEITRRGWMIVVLGLALALTMVGAGLALRSRAGAGLPSEDHLERIDR